LLNALGDLGADIRDAKEKTRLFPSFFGSFRASAVPARPALGDLTNMTNDSTAKDKPPLQMMKPAAAFGGPSAPHGHLPESKPVLSDGFCCSDIGVVPNEEPEVKMDPTSVSEYLRDIYTHLREEEVVRDRPQPEYMSTQSEINSRMRGILVDWLIEVHMKYRLKSETLFLTVKIIDAFVSRKNIPRRKLQLVGVAATLIASKYEEIHPPSLSDLVYICDRAYTREAILQMELAMLNVVDFELRGPTTAVFLSTFAEQNGCNEAHRHLVQYLAEMALTDLKMIRYLPSQLAAAAVLLSNKLLQIMPCWPVHMATHTGYSDTSIRDCAKELCQLLEQAPSAQLQAVYKKFSRRDFSQVAKMTY
jgi:cyclin B